MEQRDERSAMWRHARDRHGSLLNFRMSVTGVFQDVMLSQITESVNIKNTPTDDLNTKAEWSYVSVPRAVITSI